MPAFVPSPISSRRKQSRTPGKWKPARARLNCTWRGIGAQTNVREMPHALSILAIQLALDLTRCSELFQPRTLLPRFGIPFVGFELVVEPAPRPSFPPL